MLFFKIQKVSCGLVPKWSFRYDGYDFKVFRFEIDSVFGISSNTITTIFEDDEGFLWIWK